MNRPSLFPTFKILHQEHGVEARIVSAIKQRKLGCFLLEKKSKKVQEIIWAYHQTDNLL